MKYYFKKYDISDVDFSDIQSRVDSRMKEKEEYDFGERMDLTNSTDTNENARFGYAGEELIRQLDSEIVMSDAIFSKYDYTKWEKYIDLKSIKTGASLSDIIQKRYKTYLLRDQVILARDFCDENGIDYRDFCFEILYWNGGGEECVRSFNNGLRLSSILETEPVLCKPYGTYGCSEPQWNYIVKMVGSQVENIFL